MKKNEPLKNNDPSMSLMYLLNKVDELNNLSSDDCDYCGYKSTLVKFEDLPYSTRKAFTELLKMPEFKNGATYLYCKHCDLYAILCSPDK